MLKTTKCRIATMGTLMKILLVMLFLITFVACGGSGGSSDPPSNGRTITKSENPIFKSPLDIASDPSVIRMDADTLHLYYTAEDYKIGLAVSDDNGTSWHHPAGSTTEDFDVLRGQPSKWDQVLETVDVVKVGSEYWMYYTGYREGESDNLYVENYQIGLAISTDGGLSFVRHPTSVDTPIVPINTLDDTAMDRHAMTSPSVVLDGSQFYMIYTGWNTTDDWTGQGAGFWTVVATSADGIIWDKQPVPLLTSKEIPWTENSINESDIVLSSDGIW